MHQRWEYLIMWASVGGRVILIDYAEAPGLVVENVVEKLKELGRNGWELVGSPTVFNIDDKEKLQYTFKRPIPKPHLF